MLTSKETNYSMMHLPLVFFFFRYIVFSQDHKINVSNALMMVEEDALITTLVSSLLACYAIPIYDMTQYQRKGEQLAEVNKCVDKILSLPSFVRYMLPPPSLAFLILLLC
jgi:hypothetical protein